MFKRGRPRRVVGKASPGEITFAISFFWGKSFLFRVAIKAAPPCSAHAQIALSFGSGDTSLSSNNVFELCLLTEHVDGLPNEMASYTELLRTALH
jgi:hypothetical protein